MVHLCSRPYLEQHVRRRVRALLNVEILPRCEATGLVGAHGRVTGVRIVRHTGADRATEDLPADLVVDATGRGGRTTAWLPTLGYPPPPEERFAVDIAYASRRLRLAPGVLGARRLILVGGVPGRPTTFGLIAQEDNWWMLTLGGYAGHHPPTDARGMLEFAEPRVPAAILAAVRDAEPLDEVVPRRFPASLRRRYERLPRFPAGLLVLGDAICSFNPIYGQGMTVAALQALALRDCLADSHSGDDDLARRFFRAAAGPVEIAWRLCVGGDLALPEVHGHRPPAVRATNAYLDRLLTSAEDDPVLSEQFLEVLGFLAPPTRILRPTTVLRVLRGGRRAGRPTDAGARAGLPGPPRP